ncbi:hypothetical protein NB723_000086 [Xanthomonas sacchari]|nr:hypothetical protein [Xanthomonas sacchari]
MTNQALQQWIIDETSGNRGNLPNPNALTATFQLSVLRLLSLGILGKIHEEPATGFLMGSLASYGQLCSSAFDVTGRATWQYHSKASSGGVSESKTGADFALIIESNFHNPRLAIFQAKRVIDLENDTIKIHHVTNPEGDINQRTPQFIKLLDNAISVAQDAAVAVDIHDIHWTHYLSYAPDSMRCNSLDKLAKTLEAYNVGWTTGIYPKVPDIVVSAHEPSTFYWLLTKGASEAEDASTLRGWLEITPSALASVKGTLLNFTDIFIAKRLPDLTPDYDYTGADSDFTHQQGPNHPGDTEESNPRNTETDQPVISSAELLSDLLKKEDVPQEYENMKKSPSPKWRSKIGKQ